MSEDEDRSCIAFEGPRRLAAGPLREVRPLVQAALGRAEAPVLVFDAQTSRQIEVAPAGAPSVAAPPDSAEVQRGRGRPRLGVVAREVTLLPRHWEWLNGQPGGASAALRRLVEDARRSAAAANSAREAREAAYRFMSAMAGDLPGFEEATRALFRGERGRFGELIEGWPSDIREHALGLAAPGLDPPA